MFRQAKAHYSISKAIWFQVRSFSRTAMAAQNPLPGISAGANLTITSSYKMKSGFEIPLLGYGVGISDVRDPGLDSSLMACANFEISPADVASSVVTHALKTGYRHVDSAQAYRNEAASAAGMLAANVPRDQLFYTTKVPPKSISYEAAKKCIDESIALISPPEQTGKGLSYIDLYLLHCPYGGKEARLGAWKALVEGVQEGKIRSIGVSNYGVHHLDELEAYIAETDAKEGPGAGGVLSVNQVELHPWLQRADIVEWCRKRGVLLEAYSPLVRAQRSDDPLLQPLMKKHGKTAAQILVRWSLQKGFVPLPKGRPTGLVRAVKVHGGTGQAPVKGTAEAQDGWRSTACAKIDKRHVKAARPFPALLPPSPFFFPAQVMSGRPVGSADHPPHGHPDSSTQAAEQPSTSSRSPASKPGPPVATPEHASQGGQSAADAASPAQLSGLTLKLRQALRQYPDFPEKGILFEDIMPIFADPSTHQALIDALAIHVTNTFGEGQRPDVIVGLDARGFLFGPSLALRLGAGFVPVRKRGKLPGNVVTATYKKEYGEDHFQLQEDSIKQGQRVIIVDDIIATAAGSLVKQAGGTLLEYIFMMELDFLKGRDKLDEPVYTLLSSHIINPHPDRAEHAPPLASLKLRLRTRRGGLLPPILQMRTPSTLLSYSRPFLLPASRLTACRPLKYSISVPITFTRTNPTASMSTSIQPVSTTGAPPIAAPYVCPLAPHPSKHTPLFILSSDANHI
ncbi:hypothetical protein FH972_024334 [Carpinus fangiana]|uniref:adenine phosphoribosyltransferase n=1 Tax=Carpinus fangiana TaxID=176857 RepID=A0A5N6KY71_9ROSI|nr:hypothetical protein FH972_024334 [Carpinus fangiana]